MRMEILHGLDKFQTYVQLLQCFVSYQSCEITNDVDFNDQFRIVGYTQLSQNYWEMKDPWVRPRN